eukprot:gene5871-6790_t
MSLDPSGARLITGSYDCKVKFWDFNGMNSSLQSFREIEPVEGAQIRSINFNAKGDRFIVLPYTVQMKLYDRDGFANILTGAAWNPLEEEQVITSSIDSTIRLWDVNQPNKNLAVIKSRNNKGTRVGVTCCAYDVRGDVITGGVQDGSITMWDARSSLAKPKGQVAGAHSNDISSVQYARDGITMISRSLDHTLKVWDLRALDQPLAVFADLQCDYLESNAVFGSHDRLIVTGTSALDKEGFGTLVIYDRTTLTKMRQIRIPGASALHVLWNEKINQILVGCADGATRFFYDPDRSTRGIRMCVNKAPRKKDPADFEPDRPIITPFALPLFKQPNVGKKERTKKDRARMHRPEESSVKAATGSRGPNLTQHLIKNIGLVNDEKWKVDPREAFLSVAQEAENDPKYFKTNLGNLNYGKSEKHDLIRQDIGLFRSGEILKYTMRTKIIVSADNAMLARSSDKVIFDPMKLFILLCWGGVRFAWCSNRNLPHCNALITPAISSGGTTEEISKNKKCDLSDEQVCEIIRNAEKDHQAVNTSSTTDSQYDSGANVNKANKKIKKMVPKDEEFVTYQ